MNQQAQALEHASVRQVCKAVKVPVVGANFVQLAEQAVKENRSHIGYLEALLAMESEERDSRAPSHRAPARLSAPKLPFSSESAILYPRSEAACAAHLVLSSVVYIPKRV